MKTLYLFLALLLSANLMAQSGKVIYEEKYKIDMSEQIAKLEEMPGMEEMVERLKKMRSEGKKTLEFKGSESIYRNYDATEDSEVSWSSDDGQMEMRVVMMRPENKLYKNIESNEVVDQRDLMGKTFIIEQEAETQAWKIIPEQEVVAGHLCQKASMIKDSVEYFAWFTTQAPYAFGPNSFSGLPGLVLRVEAADESLKIRAVQVDLEAEVENIEKPTKGKKVSQEEFEEIRREKMKEMREMRGGNRGGGMHMRIERD